MAYEFFTDLTRISGAAIVETICVGVGGGVGVVGGVNVGVGGGVIPGEGVGIAVAGSNGLTAIAPSDAIASVNTTRR